MPTFDSIALPSILTKCFRGNFDPPAEAAGTLPDRLWQTRMGYANEPVQLGSGSLDTCRLERSRCGWGLGFRSSKKLSASFPVSCSSCGHSNHPPGWGPGDGKLIMSASACPVGCPVDAR